MRSRLVAAVLAAALASCRSPAPAPPPPGDRAAADAALREAIAEGDRAWPRRGDPGALAEALGAYRRAAALRPGDPAAELALSRGEAFRALAAATPAEAREAWAASARAGERALRTLSPAWAAAVDAGAPPADAAAKVEAPGAEALYRVGLGLLRAAQATGWAAVVAAKDAVVAALARAAALDERVDAAGPDRALGGLLAALPTAAGGGAGAARARFDRARALFPREQLGRVLEAETYAVLVQDGALFDRLLAEVQAFDPATWPEREPEGRLARERARALSARRARLF